MKTVWVYYDTSKQPGDDGHLTVFANSDAAAAWFERHNPEGVAFEYPILDAELVAPSIASSE